jgi:hypothetical protein
MIEVTVVEVLLFCWAIFATGAWLKAKENRKSAEIFINAILNDDDLREHFVADYKKFRSKKA